MNRSRDLFQFSTDVRAMHHAYFLEGDVNVVCDKLVELLEEGGHFDTKQNPDLWKEIHQSFAIDDARRLKDIAFLKPVMSSHRIFILGAWSIPDEAQNALLKLFEEPSMCSRFFLVIPRRDILLPTLLSRLEYGGGCEREDTEGIDALRFVKALPAERIKMLEGLIKEKKREQAIRLMKDLERVYYERKAGADTYKTLWRTSEFLADEKLGLKMIMENASLVLPVEK